MKHYTHEGLVLRPGFQVTPGRAPNELYTSPPESIRAFLHAETFEGSIWEPACGLGAISKELKMHGYDEVVSSDLADYGYGQAGVDFLQTTTPMAKNIITNPPYGKGLADLFIRKSLEHISHTGGKVAMLLNLQSLCHPSRHHSYTKRPPARIYALDQCTCYPNGDTSKLPPNLQKQRYVWMVWTHDKALHTSFHWLTTEPYMEW